MLVYSLDLHFTKLLMMIVSKSFFIVTKNANMIIQFNQIFIYDTKENTSCN